MSATLKFTLRKSTFPSSRLVGSPGDQRVNYKNMFLCRHAGTQGWDGEALVGILQQKPSKCEDGKTGRRSRKDIGSEAQLRNCGLKEKCDLGLRE